MKRNLQVKGLIPLTLLCFTLITSCTKDLFNTDKFASNQWNPEFAIGLASGSVGISDINLNTDSYLLIAGDKSASIVYNGSFKTYRAADFIPSLSSTQQIQTYSFSPTEALAFSFLQAGASTPKVSSSITQTVSTQTSVNVDIDSVLLKTGALQLDINNTFAHIVKVDLTVPGVLRNGVPVTGTATVQPNTKGTISIDISNLMTNLTKGGTTSNSLEVKYDIVFTKTASTSTAGSIAFTSNLVNPAFKLAYCDAKSQQITLTNNDSILLNVFKSAPTGSFSLNDAIVKLNFSNSFGIPIGVNITQVKGFTPATGNFFLNAAGITPQTFNITAAANVNQTASSTLSLNKTNPTGNGALLSLPDFLSRFPKAMTPQFSATTNPTGVTRPAYKNFVTDTSKISITTEITIPFDFKSSNFVVRDTFDFEFGTIDNIESFILRAYFNNGFPVTLAPRFTFTDASYNSIFVIDGQTSALINAATIDATGKVTAKTATTSDFPFSATVVQNLSKVKKVIMSASMTTSNSGSQFTKIYSDYLLDVKIGAKAKLKQ